MAPRNKKRQKHEHCGKIDNVTNKRTPSTREPNRNITMQHTTEDELKRTQKENTHTTQKRKPRRQTETKQVNYFMLFMMGGYRRAGIHTNEYYFAISQLP